MLCANLPEVGQNRANCTHPKHSQIWQSDVAQIWFTYGKPVPARQLENGSGPDLFHLRQTGAGRRTENRSGPDLVHLRQTVAGRQPELPYLSRNRAESAGYLGYLPVSLVSSIHSLINKGRGRHLVVKKNDAEVTRSHRVVVNGQTSLLTAPLRH